MLRLTRPARQSLGPVQKRFASHGTSFEPPTGKLFNEPHLKAGEKRTKDSWENLWVFGFGGATVMAIIIAINKPDDTYLLQSRLKCLR
ncbi:Putative uncharacterized protein [Taphrina deformans PYCC 5710]|uniref:Uncharacterized protein n=1 Tax=Taphrina deformans (strain PYCC 5710 / ATCC 11124 / CBS 356.35 / IMI 108563 / JCM 9778 / NBRC 8474) TaxID=1097556 RepID=R4XAC1_TAPDE|nr:Putative uncharacterized protein [Taphrina deformans PYCC 5710]|eukprot:CCG82457.1 Putative uncharacterized protein [Taphrina deformans PYCC 5710]